MNLPIEQLSDDELVALCVGTDGSDTRAFQVLFDRHRQLVWSVCRRYFREPEDVADRVQDVFFRAYRKLGTYQGGHPDLFRAWLRQLANNVCKNELRRLARRPQTVSDEGLVEPGQPSRTLDDIVREDSRATLRLALEALSGPSREILEMAEIQELPYGEIAQRLGIGLSAVKMRVVRARVALAARMRPEANSTTTMGRNDDVD